MSTPSPTAAAFVRVAMVGGTAVIVLTLLWVMEIVSLPIFIGGLIVIAVAEGVAIMSAVRRAQRAANPRQVDTTGAHGTVGYDPMDGLRGPTDRPFDGR